MLIAYIRIIESRVEWRVSIEMSLCEFVIIDCYYALYSNVTFFKSLLGYPCFMCFCLVLYVSFCDDHLNGESRCGCNVRDTSEG